VLRAIAEQNQRRPDERIGVDFGEKAQGQLAALSPKSVKDRAPLRQTPSTE
jgi:hypothetical protein